MTHELQQLNFQLINIVYIIVYLIVYSGKSFNEVKFSTRCWFLTLYCHHIALIPAFTKHTRRYRTVRDLQKLVKTIIFSINLFAQKFSFVFLNFVLQIDEIANSESEWKSNPTLAARNKELLRKWKTQLKVNFTMLLT